MHHFSISELKFFVFRVSLANESIANVFVILGMIFPIVANDVRKSHITSLMKMLQSVDFTSAFFLIFQLVGCRVEQPHRDFLLFIIITVFMIHASAVGVVFEADKLS